VKSDQHASYGYGNMQNPTIFSPSFVLDKAGTYTAQFIVNDATIDGDPVAVTISCYFLAVTHCVTVADFIGELHTIRFR
jgi:hypothetical protein